ncbi:pentatricopeptide repeat-containing protein At5g46460, mitochondrial-like [Eucalyptus grandis]|uniref:pentatricopeptide repeat-containing protein At5g46460, mitochondrial-like n=1 Tax=Eucalyptus grandis TaxID=71139 RepID=UPI00192EF769|nr:pentatricopeptide repeat-containing protein At5g46460, mitochondrial-like [Eucalyptus grandis]
MIVDRVRTGRLDDALKLFYQMPVRDAICWNTMIKGYLDCMDLTAAEELFDEMPEPGVEWAEVFFQQMPIRDLATWNAMIHGYCENARVDDAVKLFEQMPSRNVISWTSMIVGLDQNGKSEEGLNVFERMFKSGVVPNLSTLTFVCASLITFYANCKRIERATQVFYEAVHRNVVICTALLTGYGLNGRHEDGLKVFSDMMSTKCSS